MKETIEQAAKQYYSGIRELDKKNVYDNIDVDSCRMVAFKAGARWQSEQSPWICINDRNVIMPNDKVCLLRLEDGSIVRDTEEWEDCKLIVTHWMPIPSFDDILEANKDVLTRIKEKGD